MVLKAFLSRFVHLFSQLFLMLHPLILRGGLHLECVRVCEGVCVRVCEGVFECNKSTYACSVPEKLLAQFFIL